MPLDRLANNPPYNFPLYIQLHTHHVNFMHKYLQWTLQNNLNTFKLTPKKFLPHPPPILNTFSSHRLVIKNKLQLSFTHTTQHTAPEIILYSHLDKCSRDHREKPADRDKKKREEKATERGNGISATKFRAGAARRQVELAGRGGRANARNCLKRWEYLGIGIVRRAGGGRQNSLPPCRGPASQRDRGGAPRPFDNRRPGAIGIRRARGRIAGA